MPQEITSSGFPINLDHVSNNCPRGLADFDDDAFLTNKFRAYLRVVEGRELHFSGPDCHTGELLEITVPAASFSRYTRSGRQKLKHKLSKRLGHGQAQSVLLTLTIDPKRFSKCEAWEVIWKEYAAFRRDLLKYLQRQGRTHSPLYVAVIEQHKSGFPHLHIAYPGLRYLAPKSIINKCWRMGTTHVEGSRKDNQSVMTNALKYALKYISKLSGWTEEGLAHLWHSRARLYNISPKLYATPKEPKIAGWVMIKIAYVDEATRELARRIARLRFLYRIHRKEVPHHPDIAP